jgi:hypothetical protein
MEREELCCMSGRRGGDGDGMIERIEEWIDGYGVRHAKVLNLDA